MADNEARKDLYSYKENSNLVLSSSHRSRNNNDFSGEAESLKYHLKGKMGDKAVTIRPDSKNMENDRITNKLDESMKPFNTNDENILTQQDMSNYYIPKTQSTRLAYEALLYKLSVEFLSNQPDVVISAAANEVMEIFLGDERSTADKIQDLCDVLSLKTISTSKFSELQAAVLLINDYSKVERNETRVFQAKVGRFEEKNKDIEMELEIDFEELEEENNSLGHSDAMSIALSDDGLVTSSNFQSNIRFQTSESVKLETDDIGPFWLQLKLQSHVTEQNKIHELTAEVLKALNSGSVKECENRLMQCLGAKNFDLVQELVENREIVYYSTLLKQSTSKEDIVKLEQDMTSSGLSGLYDKIMKPTDNDYKSRATRNLPIIMKEVTNDIKFEELDYKHQVDLVERNMKLEKEIILPKNSWQKSFKGYEEVYVPPSEKKVDPNEKLIRIKDLPPYCEDAFKGLHSLNRVQSKIYKTALCRYYNGESVNMLVCAPTGAGKTNVAMLTIMNEIHLFYDSTAKKLNMSLLRKKLKIIYVAPMKALVQEIVEKYSRILQPYGIIVSEMSGDLSLTKKEIGETQIIVATPEKFDVISRKKNSYFLLHSLNLVIFDEVHLLHNERGAVIESLVCRLKGLKRANKVRIVALSATLPNFADVAQFLDVPEEGLFYFNNSFRPCPLQQVFIGVSEKRALKAVKVMNRICYEKVLHQLNLEKKNQILVFVHSRNETYDTAKMFVDEATEDGKLGLFLNPNNTGNLDLLKQKCNQNGINTKLSEVLKFGIGLHHAGLNRYDRNMVEELFLNKNIRVLVSTATLAWGVVVKGTQVYNLRAGAFTELSFIDILQMLGRAGRPQFDSFGTGIIITSHRSLQRYLSLTNEQLPIESRLIRQLPNALNAEIVRGTVSTFQEALSWVGNTYLNVRMRKNPVHYGVNIGNKTDISSAVHVYQNNLIHAALKELTKAGLIEYTDGSNVKFNDFARIASHFYLSHETMALYINSVKTIRSDVDLLRLFSLSSEFDNISVRAEEKVELKTLSEFLPIPLKDDFEERSFKVCCLLQCYISKHILTSFSIKCDLIYIYMNAQRILRALFEVSLQKGYAILSRKCLDMANMVSSRLWTCQFFLREIVFLQNKFTKFELEGKDTLSSETLDKLERLGLRKEQYFALSKNDILTLLKEDVSIGRRLNNFVSSYPRFKVHLSYTTVNRKTIRIVAKLAPNFEFNEQLYGKTLVFWAFVESNDGNIILHYERFTVTKAEVQVEGENINFTIQLVFTVLVDATFLPKVLFVRIKSDLLTQCDYVFALSLKNLILPKMKPKLSQVLDLLPNKLNNIFSDPLSLLTVHNQLNDLTKDDVDAIMKKLQSKENQKWIATVGSVLQKVFLLPSSGPNYFDGDYLNSIQNQCLFSLLFKKKCFISSPCSSGKISMIEISIIGIILENIKSLLLGTVNKEKNVVLSSEPVQQLVDQLKTVKIVVVVESEIVAAELCKWWKEKFTKIVSWSLRNYFSQKLDRDNLSCNANINVMNIQTLQKVLSQGTRLIEFHLDLLVFHDFSNISTMSLGMYFEKTIVTLEALQNDARKIESRNNVGCTINRLVLFSKPVYNSDDISSILGISKDSTLSFSATVGKMSPKVYIHGISYLSVKQMIANYALEVLELLGSKRDTKTILYVENKTLASLLFSEIVLLNIIGQTQDLDLNEQCMAIISKITSSQELSAIETKFATDQIRLLFVTFDMHFIVRCNAPCVIICEGSHQRVDTYKSEKSLDYISTLQLMVDKAYHRERKPECFILTHKRNFEEYQRVIKNPIWLESTLFQNLSNFYLSFLVMSPLSKQQFIDILTKTFFYRRVLQNPNYYGFFGKGSTDINEYFSNLVEDSVSYMQSNGIIKVTDNFYIEVSTLGKISYHYDINQETVSFFNSCLTKSAKYKSLLEIISCANEFITVLGPNSGDHHFYKNLSYNQECCKLSLSSLEFSSASLKVNVLTQAYISKFKIPLKHRKLQQEIIVKIQMLLTATIDICVHKKYLKTAFVSIEMKQMLNSKTWKTQSELFQIPLLKPMHVEKFKGLGINTLEEFLNMEDQLRVEVLDFSQEQLMNVANFCNQIPDVSFSMTGKSRFKRGTTCSIEFEVLLNSYEETNNDSLNGGDQHFFHLIVGDISGDLILGHKRFQLICSKKLVSIPCTMPNLTGMSKFQAYLVCENFRGLDVLSSFEVELL